jgi:hypothetical protein
VCRSMGSINDCARRLRCAAPLRELRLPCSGPVAFTDLLRREPAATNAAAPARRRSCRGPGLSFDVGAPGSYQFAATLRTPSLNHRLMSLKILLSRYSVISFVVLTGTVTQFRSATNHASRSRPDAITSCLLLLPLPLPVGLLRTQL